MDKELLYGGGFFLSIILIVTLTCGWEAHVTLTCQKQALAAGKTAGEVIGLCGSFK